VLAACGEIGGGETESSDTTGEAANSAPDSTTSTTDATDPRVATGSEPTGAADPAAAAEIVTADSASPDPLTAESAVAGSDTAESDASAVDSSGVDAAVPDAETPPESTRTESDAVGATPEEQAAQETTPPSTTRTQTRTVRFALTEPVTASATLDPLLWTTNAETLTGSMCMEQLARLDITHTPVPHLAESWQVNDTANEWAFKLRDDVKFHNGKPLVAADVLHTFRRLFDPPPNVAAPEVSAAGLLAGLESDGLSAPDDHTVVMRLTQPNADWPVVVANSRLGIVPEGAGASDLSATSLGTGPFRGSEFAPGGAAIAFGRHDAYWLTGLPAVDFLEVVAVSDAAEQLEAIKSGAVDVLARAPSESLASLAADSNVEIVTNPVGASSVAYCQINKAPFDNNDLRLAIKYASNREQHNLLAAEGRAHLMNDIPVPSIVRFGIGGVRQHDPALAREHLNRAGYPNGIDLRLAIADIADWLEWAPIWQRQLAEVSINVELDVTPAATYWSEQWQRTPFGMTSWGVPSVDSALGLWYASGSAWNETRWASENFDDALLKAHASTDNTERASIYADLQRQIINEGGHFVSHMSGQYGAVRRGITGWYPGGPFHTLTTT